MLLLFAFVAAVVIAVAGTAVATAGFIADITAAVTVAVVIDADTSVVGVAAAGIAVTVVSPLTRSIAFNKISNK